MNPYSFYNVYGVSSDIITNLPNIKAKVKHLSTCVICTSDIRLGDDIIILSCAGHHFFHSEYIKKWLLVKMMCPVCRSENVLRLY